MDGEQKCLLIFTGLIAFCITVLYTFLFISLWSYREYVGGSLLGLIIFVVVMWRVVDARGKLNEQELRHGRYRHNEETPLDAQGEAQYMPQGAQVNPHRIPPYYYQSYQYAPEYQLYQTQEQKERQSR